MNSPCSDDTSHIYAELFASMHEGIAVYEAVNAGEDFRIIDMNPAALSLARLDREQVIGRTVTEVFPAVTEIGLFDVFRDVWRSGAPQRLPATRYHDGRVEQWVENYVFRTPSGRIVAVYEDYSDRERAVSDRNQSEEQLRLISENTTDGLMVFELGEPRYVSPAYRRLLGYRSDEELPTAATALRKLIHPEDRDRVLAAFAAGVSEKRSSLIYTYRGRLKSGEYRWREDSVRLIYDEAGRHMRTYVVARDVHERVEAERKLEAKHREVERLLEEKELLLREVHHRMKNDMNLVRSLLSLQAHAAADGAAEEMLMEAGRRVGIMSQVYDRLHSGPDMSTMELCPFLEEIAADLRYGGPLPGLTVHTDCSDIEVPTRVSVSIGIIVNELVTNSAKYAFSGVEAPSVRISSGRGDAETIRLVVEDNGAGYPDEQLSGTAGYGFGLTLVSSLAAQHEGMLILENAGGARAKVTIRLPGGS